MKTTLRVLKMNKSTKDKNPVYKSFEQFKAELFPASNHKSNSASSQEDINSLAVCLAETSFNKILHHETNA